MDGFLFWSSTLASDQFSAVHMVVNAKILLIGGPFLLLFDSKGREASVALWLAGVGTKVFLFFSSAIAAVFAAPDNF